jgi:para-aminobenzoate synthetase/4-amino-4-deoxychorismate lyase
MRIIHALDLNRASCGAVGVVRPTTAGGCLQRADPTVTARAGVRCSTGSGITADAPRLGEWREWNRKRAFVRRASQPFELLETLGWGDHYRHIQHLARLASTRLHFGS